MKAILVVLTIAALSTSALAEGGPWSDDNWSSSHNIGAHTGIDGALTGSGFSLVAATDVLTWGRKLEAFNEERDRKGAYVMEYVPFHQAGKQYAADGTVDAAGQVEESTERQGFFAAVADHGQRNAAKYTVGTVLGLGYLLYDANKDSGGDTHNGDNFFGNDNVKGDGNQKDSDNANDKSSSSSENPPPSE
jgi:hypothetical protein